MPILFHFGRRHGHRGVHKSFRAFRLAVNDFPILLVIMHLLNFISTKQRRTTEPALLPQQLWMDRFDARAPPAIAGHFFKEANVDAIADIGIVKRMKNDVNETMLGRQ